MAPEKSRFYLFIPHSGDNGSGNSCSFRCKERTSHQRRKATNAHTPSTTPNGQVPASHPYREEAPQAIAKTRIHQEERFSKAYEISMTVTAHAPKSVSEFIIQLSSEVYPEITIVFHTNLLLSDIICNKQKLFLPSTVLLRI